MTTGGDLPAGEVTFLFSDIEGSTSRWERDPEGMRAALGVHDERTRAAVQQQGGVLVKDTGDGVFAAFASPGAAVAAAVDLQRALAAEDWKDDQPLRVRIGIHTASATPERGDYHGRAVNRCARVMGAAHGGQVLVTEATATALTDDAGIGLEDLGPHRLRDFDRATRLYQVLHDDLPSAFPPLRTLDQFPNNLPETTSSLVGRDGEVEHLRGALAQARLVTLTGAGGVGKTRLATELGAELLANHPDGVWLVELGTLQAPELVERAVATALRVPDQPGRTTGEALRTFVADRELLVVLDNCEHLLGAVAETAEGLLRHAPALRLVATSREPLAIPGEHVFAVSPLPVASVGPAVQLFLERARAANAAFDTSAVDLDAVAGICQRLDGLPLAIELAASRVRVMSVDELGRRLDDRFRLLTGGSRTALPRQRTLEATVAWSYDLLPDDAQALFRALSVFSSPFRLEDAEAVIAAGGADGVLDEAGVLDGVLDLADRSLLVAETRGGGTRYRMLETLRAYARERLADTGEATGPHRAHADWAATRAHQIAPELDGPEQAERLDTVESMIDDLRTAMVWCHDAGHHDRGAAIASDLYRYWYIRGVQEGSEWYRRFVPHADELPPELSAKLRYCHGSLLQVMGRYEESSEQLREAVELYRRLDQHRGLAYALHYLARSQWDLVPHREVRDLLDEALEIFRAMGDPVGEGLTLLFVALNEYVMAGSIDGALRAIEECERLMRSVGAPQLVAHGAEIRAWFLGAAGRMAEAAPLMHEAIGLYGAVRNPNCGAHCLENTALLLSDRDPEVALTLLGATERLRAEIGVPPPPYENLGFADAQQRAEALVAHDVADAAWQRGAELDFDAALQVAAEAVSQPEVVA